MLEFITAIVIAQATPSCLNYFIDDNGDRKCLTQSRNSPQQKPVNRKFITELENGDRLYLKPKTIVRGKLPRNKFAYFWVETEYGVKAIDGTYKVFDKYKASCTNQTSELREYWTYRTRGKEKTIIPDYLRESNRVVEGYADYAIWQSVCGG